MLMPAHLLMAYGSFLAHALFTICLYFYLHFYLHLHLFKYFALMFCICTLQSLHSCLVVMLWAYAKHLCCVLMHCVYIWYWTWLYLLLIPQNTYALHLCLHFFFALMLAPMLALMLALLHLKHCFVHLCYYVQLGCNNFMLSTYSCT